VIDACVFHSGIQILTVLYFPALKERAIETGRIVPQKVLAAALEQVPKSVEILAPLVDYRVELSNAADIVLVNPPGENWESFQKQWIQ
jgi:hypothetical protein